MSHTDNLGGGRGRKGEERLVGRAQVTPSLGCKLRSLHFPQGLEGLAGEGEVRNNFRLRGLAGLPAK